MSEASVIIPNFNGKAFLDDCLKSLQEQSFLNFEIILVDNGSQDGSIEFVEEHYPKVRVLKLEKNYGFCRAVNVGIRAAAAPYVILLNNDVKADRNLIKELVSGIKKRPGSFSCAAKMLQMYETDKIDDAGDYYCALGWAFALGKDKPKERYSKSRKIFAACGGASIYKKAVFEEIGYFDEKHFAYLEDIDVGYRASIYGYSNWYLPEAVVYHAGSGTSGSRYNEFKIRHSSRNNVYMLYKNMPILQILLNLPFLAAGFLIKGIFFTKRGYGLEYMNGIKEGIRMSCGGKKVKFEKKNLFHYVKIQGNLWVNIVRRAVDA